MKLTFDFFFQTQKIYIITRIELVEETTNRRSLLLLFITLSTGLRAGNLLLQYFVYVGLVIVNSNIP